MKGILNRIAGLALLITACEQVELPDWPAILLYGVSYFNLSYNLSDLVVFILILSIALRIEYCISV